MIGNNRCTTTLLQFIVKYIRTIVSAIVFLNELKLLTINIVILKMSLFKESIHDS